MSIANRRPIKKIEDDIKKIDKEIKPILSAIKKLQRSLIPLKILRLIARGADATATIARYLSTMISIWWWTIIGAIIDIFIVIPAIFLAYSFGFVKGKAGKEADKKIKDVEEKIKTEQEKIKGKEKEKRELYKAKNKLMQVFQAPAEENA